MTVVGLLPRLRISLRLFSALAPSAPIPTLAPCQKSRLVASLPNATAPAGSVIGLDVSAAAAIPVAATLAPRLTTSRNGWDCMTPRAALPVAPNSIAPPPRPRAV